MVPSWKAAFLLGAWVLLSSNQPLLPEAIATSDENGSKDTYASRLASWFSGSASTPETPSEAFSEKDIKAKQEIKTETASEQADDVCDNPVVENDVEIETATELKSPLLNRELTTGVKAHSWPTLPLSNAVCEAVAFFQQEDHVLVQQQLASFLTSSFLEAWIAHVTKDKNDNPQNDWKTATKAVLDVVEKDPSLMPYHALLQWSLQLRANSPLCEVHRQVARQTLQQTNQLSTHTSDVLLVALSSSSKAILFEPDEISNQDWSFLKQGNDAMNVDNDSTTTEEEHLLPGEIPVRGNATASSSSLIILYANLDSTIFAQTYSHLLAELEALDANVPLVIRSLGAVRFEEDPLSAQPTDLSGYGVRLDIRNVEYKVFDEKRVASVEENEVLVNLTESTDLMKENFLAGVNLSALIDTSDPESNNDLFQLRNQLWDRHEQQQMQAQKIPPLWQRRQLPLQAATVLVQQHSQPNNDILVTMKNLVQDLPSVASTLVQVKIPPFVHEWASNLRKGSAAQLLQPGELFVNGRPVTVNRGSFNVFELLSVIRMEERRVHNLEKTLQPLVSQLTSPFKAMSRIHQAWMAGDSFGAKQIDQSGDDDDEEAEESSSASVYRIDVGRGWKRAVTYINDVEKDAQYRQWPRSFQQMLMSMQFGMPPSVRRNVYTITLVIDPTATTVVEHSNGSTENGGLDLAMKLMQNQFPVRLGLVIVDAQDVEKCKAWLLQGNNMDNRDIPCPVDPSIIDDDSSWVKTKSTARAVHRLVSFFLNEHGSQPGASSAYIEYFFSYIAENMDEKGELSLEELTKLHASLLEMMGLGASTEQLIEDAKEFLLEKEDELGEMDNVYGKALRFAAERGLKPGMSFLNGRPLPDTVDGIHKTFSEEQQYMMKLITSGEITDDKPRSIYGKLLSGSGVFGQMHPLLLQDSDSPIAYQQMTHPFDSSSLLIKKSDEEPQALFIMDVVVDYNSRGGLEQLSQLLSSLDQFPTSVKGESDKADDRPVAIGYRILPASREAASAPLCPILAKAGTVGVSNLQRVVELALASGETKKLEDFIAILDETSGDAVASVSEICQSGFSDIEKSEPITSRIICNGRVYEMGQESILSEDVGLLTSMGIQRAAAVSGLLQDVFPSEIDIAEKVETVSGIAQFLALEQTKATNRKDVMKEVERLENMVNLEKGELMHFQWNEATDESSSLKSRITAVLDPVHESTQHLAPLLEIMRDQLKLPVAVVLAPAPSIDGDSKVPITSFFRFVASEEPIAHFSSLPVNHVLTLRMDVPEQWDVQQTFSIQDTDNLRCDLASGCSDDAHERGSAWTPSSIKSSRQLTKVEYGLNHVLVFGQCYEKTGPPNGLQLVLSQHQLPFGSGTDEVGADDTKTSSESADRYSDTLVMKNVGYWQLRANPGVWDMVIEKESKGAEIFDFVDAKMANGRIIESEEDKRTRTKKIVIKDFTNRGELIFVKRREGYEDASLFFKDSEKSSVKKSEDEVIHVFSLATGHLYERFLKIMMLSVTKRTSSKVKFWLFENFLSPTFKETSRAMAKAIGCDVEFVTYKWPEWLRGQTEKQRIIWGYKILFLDVLFPLNVEKIIYVDADQVVRADLKELWDMDLQGAPYGYTPFCSSRETTIGYQFWRDGFWKNHLQGRPYHISALYVVDLKRFREGLVGDQLRSTYQQLSADPNSLANLDQDLPNYAQHQVPIFSLPQDWLWCESWCSDETKSTAKTIDLCNNPLHKEPKVSMAKRVIDGPLFNESWVELDALVEQYELDYLNAVGVQS